MKRTLVLILIAAAVVAAAFSWQASFARMQADEMGHGMGMDCLVHCLTTDADQAGKTAAVASGVLFAALAAVAWPSVAAVLVAFATEDPVARVRDPGRRFILSRRD